MKHIFHSICILIGCMVWLVVHFSCIVVAVVVGCADHCLAQHKNYVVEQTLIDDIWTQHTHMPHIYSTMCAIFNSPLVFFHCTKYNYYDFVEFGVVFIFTDRSKPLHFTCHMKMNISDADVD